MNTDDLIWRLTELLRTRMTKAGHLAQIVPQEHRGVCPVGGCAPSCVAAQQAITSAVEYLEAALAEQPEQMELIAS